MLIRKPVSVSTRKAVVFILLMAAGWNAAAETTSTDVQKVVDEVKAIATKARKDRSADPAVLQSLDSLVQRYYWPWRKQLLDESFKDGDYTRNPSWSVASGSFLVDASLGLRSSSTAATPAAAEPTRKKKQKIGDVLKQAMLDQLQNKNGTQPATATGTPAEIDLPLKSTNAFALDLNFSVHQPAGQAGRVEFGLYKGKRPDVGYTLAFSTGTDTVVELLRTQSDGSSVVQRKSIGSTIPVGQVQHLTWRRDADGNMTVSLNDKALLQAGDRGYTDSFGGFAIVNRGGDYAVRSITLFDAE